MDRKTSANDSLYATKIKILDTIAHGKRSEIFISIANSDKTFCSLLKDLKMSRSGLSTALLKLSKAGLIAPQFDEEQVKFSLTRTGNLLHNYIELCTDAVLSLRTVEKQRIILSAEDMIKIIESYDTKTFKHLFTGWKIILSSMDYERILDYINEKTIGQETEKFEEFEKFLFDEEMICVLKTYDNPEKTVRIEYYLRKQKKLSIDDAEMIASGVDQQAIIASNKDIIVETGLEIGLHTVKMNELEDFLQKQKLKVIAVTLKSSEGDFLKPLMSHCATRYSIADHSKYTKTDRGILSEIEFLQILG